MEKPDERCKYAATFKAEALRMARESRSAQAAARALNLNPKLLYKWPQKARLTPSEATEVRQLRAANKRLAQEPEFLKSPRHLQHPAAPVSSY